jgi:hypothetical protein
MRTAPGVGRIHRLTGNGKKDDFYIDNCRDFGGSSLGNGHLYLSQWAVISWTTVLPTRQADSSAGR